MNFLLDMGISPRVGASLREQGHGATHLDEAGLGDWNDADILLKARNERLVLLTHDLDFGDLLAASGDSLPSVITFRLRNMKSDHVTERLRLVLSRCEAELTSGAIITVTETLARVHALPISRSD